MSDPVLMAYCVQRKRSGRSIWQQIGRAYPHEAGAGLTVVLEALPLKFDGRIVLLELDDADHRKLAWENEQDTRDADKNGPPG